MNLEDTTLLFTELTCLRESARRRKLSIRFGVDNDLAVVVWSTADCCSMWAYTLFQIRIEKKGQGKNYHEDPTTNNKAVSFIS